MSREGVEPSSTGWRPVIIAAILTTLKKSTAKSFKDTRNTLHLCSIKWKADVINHYTNDPN